MIINTVHIIIVTSSLLRMMISAGESVCRPMSSALIADLFTASARGVANGVFSWGVYLGFGLAFVLGINLTQVVRKYLERKIKILPLG